MIYRFLELFPSLAELPPVVQTAVLAALACALSFVICLAAGPKLIAMLTALKAGQPIRQAAEVHKLAELHGKKVGTPTMGGLMIVGSAVVSTLLFARPENPYIAVCLGVTVVLALLGFADDFLKVKKHTPEGVSGRVKLVVQTGTALAAVSALYFYGGDAAATGLADAGIHARTPIGELVSTVSIPFYGPIDIGWLILPFGTLVIVGASNAVNLTDGLDGLASGCTIAASIAYGVIALAAGDALFSSPEYLHLPHHQDMGELAVFMMALVGACMGFLWYNCYPARIFMGDTGSLALGGALGTAAVCTCQEVLLVLIGGVFVAEALSVMMQVGWFKYTRKRFGEGRRLFRMAPLHHHFELGGVRETQVITRFWMVGLVLALLGISLLSFD